MNNEFLDLLETSLEAFLELEQVHSFIKNCHKSKSYKKKVIPITTEEYSYEDDDFTYTNDP